MVLFIFNFNITSQTRQRKYEGHVNLGFWEILSKNFGVLMHKAVSLVCFNIMARFWSPWIDGFIDLS